MAFPSEAVKEEARRRLQQGDKKPKEIAEALGCTAQDVSNLKYTMGNSSKGKKATGSKTKKAKASSHPAFKDAPEIVGILAAEQTRLGNRISNLENVLEAYDGAKASKGSPFTNAVEEEIDRTTKRLGAIEELLAGYDDAIPLRLHKQ